MAEECSFGTRGSIAPATAEVEGQPKPAKAHSEARLTSPSNLFEPPTHVHCTSLPECFLQAFNFATVLIVYLCASRLSVSAKMLCGGP